MGKTAFFLIFSFFLCLSAQETFYDDSKTLFLKTPKDEQAAIEKQKELLESTTPQVQPKRSETYEKWGIDGLWMGLGAGRYKDFKAPMFLIWAKTMTVLDLPNAIFSEVEMMLSPVFARKEKNNFLEEERGLVSARAFISKAFDLNDRTVVFFARAGLALNHYVEKNTEIVFLSGAALKFTKVFNQTQLIVNFDIAKDVSVFGVGLEMNL